MKRRGLRRDLNAEESVLPTRPPPPLPTPDGPQATTVHQKDGAAVGFLIKWPVSQFGRMMEVLYKLDV